MDTVQSVFSSKRKCFVDYFGFLLKHTSTLVYPACLTIKKNTLLNMCVTLVLLCNMVFLQQVERKKLLSISVEVLTTLVAFLCLFLAITLPVCFT